ncbi:transposase [Enterococcus sp. BWR-S5]|uniref:transposase n=1 Tax=Enterococcus sp. BWR-S5 TaxID=2787714 RepID=UPI0022AB296B|nr:transposase [Enterococcus sp. BWR-S5]
MFLKHFHSHQERIEKYVAHYAILGYDCFPNPTVTRTLRPFLTTLQEQFFDLPLYLVADARYGSEENYQTITEAFKRISLVTNGMYKKEKKKKYKNNPFHPDNWSYDEPLDSYVCPEQRTFVFRNQGLRRDRYGFTRTIRFYQCETCLACSVRAQCTKVKSTHNRVIQKIESGYLIKNK